MKKRLLTVLLSGIMTLNCLAPVGAAEFSSEEVIEFSDAAVIEEETETAEVQAEEVTEFEETEGFLSEEAEIEPEEGTEIIVESVPAEEIPGAALFGDGTGEVPGDVVFAEGEAEAETLDVSEAIVSAASRIAFGTQYKGSVSKTNAAHYYTFTLDKPSKVNVAANCTAFDVKYEMHAAHSTDRWWDVPQRDGNLGVSVLSKDFYLTAGTYYFTVNWCDPGGSMPDQNMNDGNFSFTINSTVSGETFPEAGNGSNNTPAAANSISLGKPYRSHIGSTDMVDYYKFSIPKSGIVTYKVTDERKDANSECVSYTFYNVNGEEIGAHAHYQHEDLGYNRMFLNAGVHYFAVVADQKFTDNSGYGTYSFSLTGYQELAESFQESGVGSNNTIMDADKISLGTTYNGIVTQDEHNDFYCFTVPKQMNMGLNVAVGHGNMSLNVHIYDSVGNQVNRWYTFAGSNETNNAKIPLAAGTYYLMIGYESMTERGNYTFSVGEYMLPAPSLSAASAKKGVTLSWGSVSGATGYKVYRNGTLIKTIANTSTRTYTDSAAAAGTKYTYSVHGYSSEYSGRKADAVGMWMKTPTVKAANAASGVTVTWKKVTGAAGYYVYRKKGSGSWTKIATITNANTLQYTDKAVKNKNGTTYTYTVRAYNGGFTSEISATAGKIVRMKAPTLSSLTNTKTKKLVVKWKKNKKATGYQIQYSTSKTFKNAKSVKITSKNTLTKTLSKLKKKTYYVRIRSYKKSGSKNYYSAWSTAKAKKVKK